MKTAHAILCLMVLANLFSCESREPATKNSISLMKLTDASGKMDSSENCKEPSVIQLSSMPKPKVNKVADKASGFVDPQSKPAGLFRSMKNYTTEQGLALDSVRCSMKDRAGNLWFGTYGGGASKFDGKSITNYTEAQGLASDAVQAIFEDKDGNIWFGTLGGVSKYDGVSFANYTSKDGLPHNDVLSIIADTSGNLWFGTGKGASKFDGKTFTNFSKDQGLADNAVNSITKDKDGHLWFGTTNGASRYDGKVFVNFKKEQGLIDDHIFNITQDRAGNIWFGTNGGVSKYDGTSFVNYSTKDGLVNNRVLIIFEDSVGILWFATYGGVSQFDGKSFENLTLKEGLANNEVQSILEDQAGNLWFSTKGGGVAKYPGGAFTNYTSEQGMPNTTVYNIKKDSLGNIWIGTDGSGLVKFEGTSFTNYTKEQGLNSNNAYPLFEDRSKNLWFGTVDAGLIKYDGNSFTNYSQAQGLSDDYVQFGIEDRAGIFWFGTNNGVSRFDGKSFTRYTVEQGLADNIVLGLLQDKAGNIWFATNGGLSKFDGKCFTNFTKDQGLPSNRVNAAFEDIEGNLWLSTTAGLVRYDGKSFLTHTVDQGLPDNTVWWTTPLPDGRLLIGTNHGLGVLTDYHSASPKTSDAIPVQNNLSNKSLRDNTAKFKIYNSKTGYPVKDANQGSFFVDDDGVAWFGTGSNKTGLVRFDYSKLKENKTIPKVRVQNIRINDEDIAWYNLSRIPNPTEEINIFGRILGDDEREIVSQRFKDIKFDNISKWYPVPTNLVLPYDNNSVTFDFAAIEPGEPQNILYQYQLEGYDNSYSHPTNKTFANFGNIFEGTYNFKVRAKGPNTEWSEPTTYSFKVIAPWFRTWWAYSIYVAIILAVFFLIYLWRTAALRKRQKELEILYKATERFLPKDILKILNKEHVEDVELGDSAEIEIAVMFCDIRGFTSLAEKLGPKTTARILNKYLGYMAPIVRRFNGVVDQFLGDGLLAIFDVKPEAAIAASFEMQKTLPAFNDYLLEAGIDPVQIGISVNIGPAIFSILGEEQRLQGTVISDDVNLAARVESLNKLYATHFLVTGAAYDAISDKSQYLSVLVDKVVVVGKSSVVRLYALWPLPEGEALDVARHAIAHFYEAVAFYEKGDFSMAVRLFEACHGQWPINDIPSQYIKRCIEFHKAGAPDGWDGTFTLTEK